MRVESKKERKISLRPNCANTYFFKRTLKKNLRNFEVFLLILQYFVRLTGRTLGRNKNAGLNRII